MIRFYLQDLYARTQRNARALQERNEQLEQECSRLTESLRVHEDGAKSFAVERSDHEVLQQKLESRYKSLNKKYQGEYFPFSEYVRL